MSKKKRNKPENRGKPAGMETTTPQPKTEILNLEDLDPAFETPEMEMDDRESEVAEELEERIPRKIISWGGQAHNHKCPYCGSILCHDRSTKASKVIRTKEWKKDESKDRNFKDREMLCAVCQNEFVCREWENITEKKEDL